MMSDSDGKHQLTVKQLEQHIANLTKSNQQLLQENEHLIRRLQQFKEAGKDDIFKDANWREQIEMYRLLFENAPLPYQSLNSDGTFRDVNAAWLHTLGYSRQEVIGKNYADFLHPDWKPNFEKNFPAFKKRGYVHDVQFKIRHKEGHYLDISFEGCIGYQADGKVRQTYCIFCDISERLRAEQELIRTKEMYQSIFEMAANLITSVDKNGIIVDCNSRIYDVLGYSKKEIIGQHMFKVIHPDYHERASKWLEEVLLKGYSFGKEYIFIKKDGSEIYIRVNSSGLKGGNGHYYRTICILEDFTERFKEQQALLQNERQLSNLFSNTANLFYSHTTDHQITFMSPQVEQILGYTPLEAMRKWTEFVTDHPINKKGIELTQAAIDSGEPQPTYELQLQRKDGKKIWVEVRENPIVENGKTTAIVGSLTDITERKRAQDKLKANEEKYRLLLNNQSDMVVKVNTQNEFVFVSPSYCNTFNKTEKELLGHTFMPLVHEDDREHTAAEMKKLYSPPYTCRVQQRAMTRNGWRWLEWIDSAILKDGEVAEIIGVGRDITEQKQADLALEDSRNELQTIFRVAPTGIGRINNRIIQQVNQRVIDMTGYTNEELVGQSSRIFYPSSTEFDYVGTEKYRQIRECGVGTVETRWQHKDGHILDVLLSSAVIDKNNPDKGTIFTVLDISDRKRSERELLKLSVAVQQSPSLITIADLDGNIEYVNSSFSTNTGYAAKEIVGHNMHFLNVDLDVQEIKNRLAAGLQWRGEYENKKKNGELFWEYASISPIVDENGELVNYIKVAEDVTERKKSELELQKLEKLESLGTLAGGIAHDFNNILTGLYGNISLAEAELEGEPQAFEYLLEAEKSMLRATRLTKQLLTFSKGGSPVIEATSPQEIIKEVVKFDLSGSNVKPVISSERDLWMIKVDKGQIQQVFSNLTINANQAMPRGGHLYITMKNVDVAAEQIINLQPGAYVCIQVKDEGIGIDEKYIDKVFDPYFTTKQAGNGLGLATAFSIIHQHHGHISVQSELGHGTIFTIYLPAQPKQKIQSKSKNRRDETVKHSSGKVLIMDDEEMICSLVTRMLKQVGFQVDAAADGETAIEMYKNTYDKNEPYELVIMDLTIPGGMGGKEAIKPILEINPQAKVIVSSGYANMPVMSQYADYGFKGVIEKPFTVAKLREVVTQLVEQVE